MAFKVARFLDVSEGPREGQFGIGAREQFSSLDDLEPIYRKLMDEPVTAILAVIGGMAVQTSRRSGLTMTATKSY
jgi:hypothetical protein